MRILLKRLSPSSAEAKAIICILLAIVVFRVGAAQAAVIPVGVSNLSPAAELDRIKIELTDWDGDVGNELDFNLNDLIFLGKLEAANSGITFQDIDGPQLANEEAAGTPQSEFTLTNRIFDGNELKEVDVSFGPETMFVLWVADGTAGSNIYFNNMFADVTAPENKGISHFSAFGVLQPVPLPAALPLFGIGLGIMGFVGWRRKRRMMAAAAA
ncbi:hypothetical protein MnTg02_01981 [bacterium MnTg02]|nr:hypothetical protein MnTg02_01981 [bacterium MnTg02]